jgi:hypothetical protein
MENEKVHYKDYVIPSDTKFDVNVREWDFSDTSGTKELNVFLHNATDVRFKMTKLPSCYAIEIIGNDSKGNKIEFIIFSDEKPKGMFQNQSGLKDDLNEGDSE